MATNVPGPTFGERGFVAPTDEEVLAGVQADIDTAFGGGVNPALDTPQGQLATSMTAIIAETNNTFIRISNQVDPAFAEGRFQDAIARIYFLQRMPSAPTVVQAVCTGGVGVAIPEGSRAVAADGLIYASTEAGVIGDDGTVTIPFSCVTPGPIACPEGSLNQIYQAINGWDSINNTDDGVLGRSTETRAEFESRRAASVAINSVGALPAIQGAVLAVTDVLDAYVTENDTAFPVVRQGYSLAARSLYVAVVGGASDDVARAIWSKKAPGCGYNGNTTVQVSDTDGYSIPFPTYDVTYVTPSALPILFKVTIVDSSLVPDDAAEQIQAAIIAAFAGEDGGPRARIASTIYATRYVTPIQALGDWAQVASIVLGSNNDPSAIFTGEISGSTLTVTAVAEGTIEVGQILDGTIGSGTGIILGTRITALAGGTGGTGDYTVSAIQSITSTEIIAVLPELASIPLNLDQVPTIAAANIIVDTT